MRLIVALLLPTLAVAKNAPSLRGVDSSVNGPFSELVCTFKGKTDKDTCAAATNSDDKPCSYCTESKDGEEAGLCVDPEIAVGMEEQNEDITCTNIEATEETLVRTSSKQELSKGPFDVFKCIYDGRADADKCASSQNGDGQQCSFCTLSQDGEEASLCVDPNVAEQMKQLNHDVTCTGDEVESNVGGPFSELVCTFEGKTDKDACAAATNSDDKPCSYCTESKNGEEAGLCVDPEIAAGMEEQNEDIKCTNVEETTTYLRASSVNEVSEQPFDELKCMFQGRTDADECASLENADGQQCSFCTLSEDGKEASLCVDPNVAEQLKEINKYITCTDSDKVESNVRGPFSELVCTFEGKNDKDACAAATNSDDKPCSYCTESKDGEEVGLCVDPEIAAGMEKQNEDITCTNVELQTSIKLDTNSFKCTINAINDADKCASTSTDDNQSCQYCSMNGPLGESGVCVSPDQADELKKLAGDAMSCTSQPSVNDVDIDPSSFDSNCYKVGLKGGSPDDCENTIDEASGENCTFCNAPRLGGIGLCMPSDFKGKEGHFYSCNKGTIMSTF